MRKQRLNASTVDRLAPGVATPRYDRARVTPGIVHLGAGAFHRAHQAVLVDDCLARGETGWGIVAASLRSSDLRDAIAPQDGLYTLVVRDGTGDAFRVIGAITQVVAGSGQLDALVRWLCDPRIRIVTLTVTEKGYAANLAGGTLLADHPDILHDLAHPEAPRSVVGLLVEALDRRRMAGVPPFTVVSCDNLPANGRLLKSLLVEFARLRGGELAAFIAASVACPSSMVDRIVPATTEADRLLVADALGVEDRWPVATEPFLQWVIEDDFPLGRPALEESGVEFVRDVAPFEHMKLRLLNGAHSIIAAFGQTAGLSTVADVFGDARARAFIDAYWREVAQTLDPVVDPVRYVAKLRARFDNPALRHRTAQIAMDSSRKIPQRLLAPLGERLRSGAPCAALQFALAAWMRSCLDLDERGGDIPVSDPAAARFSAIRASRAPEAVVRHMLGIHEIFDPSWSEDQGLVTTLGGHLGRILRLGVLDAAGTAFSP